MEAQKIKIAVVILNWNGKNWLQQFLPVILRHTKDAIIYVVDNNSNDDSISFLSENFPLVKIITHKENLGFAEGYNKALKKINAEYYILLNSDIEVTNDWIPPIINLMDSDKDIAACQPKLLDYKNRKFFEYAGASGGFIDVLGFPFCRGRVFEDIEEDKGQYDDAIDVFWATGACLFLRSTYFWKVGGFDEDFFAHQEEIDLCWRLKNIGYKVMVEPKSFVYHVGGGTLSTGSSYKTYLNFRNNLYMLFKNLPTFYLFFVFPIRLILDGLAAFTFLKKPYGINNFFAVIRAHFSFYFSLPNLIYKRKNIEPKKNIFRQINYNLLFQNKIKKIKKFSDL